MFSRKKIAAITALLGGLAATCAVIPQAHAADNTGLCRRDAQGNVTCLQRSTGPTQDGSYTLNQTQSCNPTKPVSIPAQGVLNPGVTQVGPAVTCSNVAPAPGEQAPVSSDQLPSMD
ncbi:hypothetical protein GCM10010211_15150 [Streptomyces albospinus]|uniref:Intersectin-EH binding protein Ibp1 n=1 Tax=Streptomyces albospinus TaxID=285515 RepID=A0ABQ2USM1_9ACTN|nr:hypothetical protein [Streptomyces albospinus]GGU51446.1 hypothetical protein GCM10010211_15150 [Streptomyces albospinus]